MKKFLKLYPKLLFIYTLVWIPLPTLIWLEPEKFTNQQIINEIAIFLVAISGFLINLFRIRERAFRKYIKNWYLDLKNSSAKPSRSNERPSLDVQSFQKALKHNPSVYATLFSGFFNEIYTEAIITSLVAIHLTMKRTNQCPIVEYDLLPLESSYYREYIDWDIEKEYISEFIPEDLSGSCNFYTDATYKIVATEHAHKVFSHIRRIDQVTDLEIAE